MRDPDRISEVLKALEAAWRASPDLRLGQLIVNATNFSGRKVVCPEIFHAEDDVMLSGIQRYVEATSKARGEKA